MLVLCHKKFLSEYNGDIGLIIGWNRLIPKNIIEGIKKARVAIGEQKFMKVLGGEGFSTLEEVPNAAAIKLLNALLKEVTNGK